MKFKDSMVIHCYCEKFQLQFYGVIKDKYTSHTATKKYLSEICLYLINGSATAV